MAFRMQHLLLVLSAPLVLALVTVKSKSLDVSCVTNDLEHRTQFQDKLADICEEMCKEVGAYPKCAQCPKFVEPDSTPGVMTWPELLEHMDNLVAWGQDSIKGWKSQASALQTKSVVGEEACSAADMKVRFQVQNKLAGICEEMCKEVGAYPKCAQCPKFVQPDSTPGVMTWPELLEHMDNLVAWGQDSIKSWKSGASALQKGKSIEAACATEDMNHRVQFQNKLAGICEEMCKEVGAYPKCAQCPKFVEPDSTPGVMTWPELLEHMDNLVAWGQDSIKGWKSQASALQTKSVVGEEACSAADMKVRFQVQNKLAGICEEMCKEVGAYPKCAQCPKFVEPDSTPGVMTWPELLEHMDNLVAWGQDSIKSWKSGASALQKGKSIEVACATEDISHRAQFQNKLAGICEEMCKEVGAYPKCAQCPKFVQPDSTPGVMTWPELLEHMDNLVAWGQDSIKGWKSGASVIQKHAVLSAVATKSVVSEEACSAEDMKIRSQLQNKLAGICEEMCKEVGAYPKCAQCPKFVQPDSTPGVMTWPELLEHMDNLVAWGQDSIKGWQSQAR